MTDWMFDHLGWCLSGLVLITAVAVVVAVAMGGGASCAKGQHEVLVGEVPITVVVNNVPITSMVPIFECQS